MVARVSRSLSPLLAMLCLTAAACSGPFKPDEASFRKALKPIVADRFCQGLDLERMAVGAGAEPPPWPLVIAESPIGHEPDGAGERAGLEQAVAGGYLTRTRSEETAKRIGYDDPPARHRLLTYAATPKGEPYFRALTLPTPSGPRSFPGVCAARGEVVEVVRWTEPAQMFGRTVSQVTYRYVGRDPIGMLTPARRAEVLTPKEATVPMVLGSDGWRAMPR